MPCAVLEPFSRHSRALAVLRQQLEASEPLKKRLWQRLVTAKISNQARCLKLCGKGADAEILFRMADYDFQCEQLSIFWRKTALYPLIKRCFSDSLLYHTKNYQGTITLLVDRRVLSAIIPYQELSGNYNPVTRIVAPLGIIPYQELSGNYNSSAPALKALTIIPYQELSDKCHGSESKNKPPPSGGGLFLARRNKFPYRHGTRYRQTLYPAELTALIALRLSILAQRITNCKSFFAKASAFFEFTYSYCLIRRLLRRPSF